MSIKLVINSQAVALGEVGLADPDVLYTYVWRTLAVALGEVGMGLYERL